MRVDLTKSKYALLIAPYLMSAIVFTITNDTFSNFLLAWKLLAFLWIAYEYLRDLKINALDGAVILYFFIWFVSTLFNGEGIVDYCKEVVVMAFYLFYFENAQKKRELTIAITVTNWILFVLLFINIVCIFVFPDGLWQTTSIYNVETNYYFLGMDNQATPLIIVSITLLVLSCKINQRITLMSFVYGTVILLNAVLMGSATCISGVIAFAVFFLLSRINKNIFNIRTSIIIVVLVYLLFVIFRAQGIFEVFIVNVLHKDIGFSARTGIWDAAIEMIGQKPIIGYGCKTFATLIRDRHAHNMYLQIMLQTGIVGFIIMINYVRVAIRSYFSDSSTFYSLLCAASLLSYGICCMMEVYNQGYLILLLAVFYVLSNRETRVEDENALEQFE